MIKPDGPIPRPAHPAVAIGVTLWRGMPRSLRWLLLAALGIGTVSTLWDLASPDPRPTVRGLPSAPRRVHVVALSPAAFNDRLRASLDGEQTPEVQCRRLGLVTGGLAASLAPTPPLAGESTQDALLGGVRPGPSAFYVPGTDTIFYNALRGTVAVPHEMVHAYEDQTGPRLRARVRTSDASAARLAAVEGTAIQVAGDPSRLLPFTGDWDTNQFILAYFLGPRYVDRTSGGDRRRMLQLQPTTTREVLMPLLEVPLPLVVTPEPAPPWCTDQWGALGILTAGRQANLPGDQILDLVRGWQGDLVRVWSDPTGPRVQWTIAFDTPERAAAWRAGPAAHLMTDRHQVAIHTVVVPRPPAGGLVDRVTPPAP